jgi:hypothetical protein
LEATPTQLLLDPGVDSSFSIGTTYVYYDGEATGAMSAQVVYENDPGSGQYYSRAGGSFGTMMFAFPSFDSSLVPTTQGSIGANASWVVATVPEPSTFVFFCIGAVGLAAHAWRRKRRAT